jgi:hypothetical protein
LKTFSGLRVLYNLLGALSDALLARIVELVEHIYVLLHLVRREIFVRSSNERAVSVRKSA